MDDNGVLSDRQYRFVQEYCKDFVATKAAERAGYSAGTAYAQGSRLLENVEIRAAIEDEKAALAAAARVTPGLVLRELLKIATDPAVCCRCCYGIGHQYQWTESEYTRALNKALMDDKPAPEFLGGFGYQARRPPVSDCPECKGEGVSLSRKDIKSADQIKALDILSRYLGMIVDKKELSGPGGGPVPLATVNVNELTDAQLAALCAGEKVIDGGTIGGTLALPAPNPLPLKELEAVSSP